MRGDGSFRQTVTLIGPGVVLAATGVGAGDLVAAAVSGSRFGFAVVWAAIVGAVFKFVMNEGLARWQLATGMTLLEGWTRYLGRWVQWVFLVYLVIWSFIVAGALMAACGLAAHAIVPDLSVAAWGAIHSILAAVLVLFGGYERFEKLIGVFVGLMFVTLLTCAAMAGHPVDSIGATIREAAIPPGSGNYILGVIGGVGGSVTLLSYGYWIREKGWEGHEQIALVRSDLGIAYTLTGIFGVAVMVLASLVLHANGAEVKGNQAALDMAEMLGAVAGSGGRWIFLFGFWGAVATSMMGVWQGVPYIFADFVRLMRPGATAATDATAADEAGPGTVDTGSRAYRGFLFWLAVPPGVLLFFDRPVALSIVYAVMSSLFMPFLAGTLLYLNSRRRWVGEARTGPVLTVLLLASLALFGYLGGRKLLEQIGLLG